MVVESNGQTTYALKTGEVVARFRRLSKKPSVRWSFLAGLILVLVWWKALPDPLFNDPFSSVLLSQDGELLVTKIADDDQWRFPPLKNLPSKFKTALLLHEDKRFPYHLGVDPAALIRSIRLNTTRKKVVSGASTITMQVIRLARKNPNRSIMEKIIEMILAVRLELGSRKKDILAQYASHAPFGGNIVGLEAASWIYYGRPPDQLSWAESCLFAVLPKSPALIHPGKNRDMLRARRDALLRRIYGHHQMDAMELKLALLEPLPDEPRALPRWAPHLLDTLAGSSHRYPSRIETTLDGPLQKSVQALVTRRSEALTRQGIGNAAAMVVDNENFEIKVYVGNSRNSNFRDSGYAIDLIRRPRSTGSILKPILYAAMLQSGDVLPSTLVPDLPTQYGNFKPENFDHRYRGAVPARLALARSLNVPAVRMLKQYSVTRFYDLLKNLGMTTLHRNPQDYGLTLIVGGAEGTLWDLTQVYANMAYWAKGHGEPKGAPFQRLKILKNRKDSIFHLSDLGPGSAWLTLQALNEVTRPDEEGYWENFQSTRKIAWKTGTSYGHKDGWAIGSDTRYTVGVWVGNADGTGIPELGGVSSAAPILFDIFNRLSPGGWFDPPHPYLKEVSVCTDNGYLPFGDCETKMELAPAESQFDRVSPHHPLVHLDITQKFRVHGLCESVSTMVNKPWFVLPPGQEYFYKKAHSEYRTLPKFRPDCEQIALATGKQNPIEFLYPNEGTEIYIPIDLAGKKGRTVFEVAHRQSQTVLFWHLDGAYIGKTESFHQQALDIEPGSHDITVVDREGNTITRHFTIISPNSGQSK